jgi:hypothetical protein
VGESESRFQRCGILDLDIPGAVPHAMMTKRLWRKKTRGSRFPDSVRDDCRLIASLDNIASARSRQRRGLIVSLVQSPRINEEKDRQR